MAAFWHETVNTHFFLGLTGYSNGTRHGLCYVVGQSDDNVIIPHPAELRTDQTGLERALELSQNNAKQLGQIQSRPYKNSRRQYQGPPAVLN
jgi:hypothetical protein